MNLIGKMCLHNGEGDKLIEEQGQEVHQAMLWVERRTPGKEITTY